MSVNLDPEQVERACEVMHDAYEAAAVGAGWETQQASRKPWEDVPEANKATMRVAVRALLASPTVAAMLAEAWHEGHHTMQQLGPDGCECYAFDESECGCGLYGTVVITPNPYRSAAAHDPR